MRAVNLLPESRRATSISAAKSQARATRMVVVTTGVAVVLIVALSGFAVVNGRSDAHDKQAALDRLQQEVNDAEAPIRANATKESQLKVRYDAVALAASPAKRMRWDTLLDAVSRALPSGAWLSSLKAQSPIPVVPDPSATPTAAAAATPSLPTAFVITGFMTSNAVLPHVLQRLALLPMLSDVWLQQSTRVEIGNKPAIQFTIAANVAGGS